MGGMCSAEQITIHRQFDLYIVFDGVLDDVAYGATIRVANDTTFDTDGGERGCVWMDTHYDWSDPEFVGGCGESFNLAVDAVADVLHTPLHRSAYRATWRS